jgi:hypothetical protein
VSNVLGEAVIVVGAQAAPDLMKELGNGIIGRPG